ncbi:MAG: hypothetical protein M0R40_05580 [Firmicutes bacterium]|nr:hypothetical protein [Bacillota bacterium]
MKTKIMVKLSSVALAVFLLAAGGFYLLTMLLEYTFVPFNTAMLNGSITVLILAFTFGGIRNRNEKIKLSNGFSMFLPLIAIFFVITKRTAVGTKEINTHLYITQSYLALICSMLMFLSSKVAKAVKFGLGLVYSFLFMMIFFILFISIFFFDFGSNTVVKSELSPNSIYLVEIIDNSQGALGGNTFVNVTRQSQNINLFVGELKKSPERIYTGRWGEFETMTLRWETDEILYINEKKYVIQDVLAK